MGNRVTAIIDEVDKARKGVAVCAVAFLVLAVACFTFSERALLVLVRLVGKKLVSYSPEEGFIALASLSLYGAFVLTLPVAGYLLWRGILLPRVPACRHWGGPVIAVASALLLRGAPGVLRAAAGLDRLPRGVLQPATCGRSSPRRSSYPLRGTMLDRLGPSQAPLLSFFLAKLGWLKPDFFRNKWRHAVLGCTVVAAIITPTPDVYNMTLMTMPLLWSRLHIVVVVVAAGKKTPEVRDAE